MGPPDYKEFDEMVKVFCIGALICLIISLSFGLGYFLGVNL